MLSMLILSTCLRGRRMRFELLPDSGLFHTGRHERRGSVALNQV